MDQKAEQMAEARAKNDKKLKPFCRSGTEVEELIPYVGACFATDRILVDGLPVGYMYREEPDFDADSGWRFLAGDETDEYLDDQWNSGLYSVNTICNYDRDIIPFVESPIGASFARDPSTGKLVATDDAYQH